MSKIIFDKDLIKIENACTNYPLGSFQMGEIAKLSGYLYGFGVNVTELLEKELLKKGKVEVIK